MILARLFTTYTDPRPGIPLILIMPRLALSSDERLPALTPEGQVTVPTAMSITETMNLPTAPVDLLPVPAPPPVLSPPSLPQGDRRDHPSHRMAGPASLTWTLEEGLTLEECAFLALVTVVPHLHLNRLLRQAVWRPAFLYQRPVLLLSRRNLGQLLVASPRESEYRA